MFSDGRISFSYELIFACFVLSFAMILGWGPRIYSMLQWLLDASESIPPSSPYRQADLAERVRCLEKRVDVLEGELVEREEAHQAEMKALHARYQVLTLRYWRYVCHQLLSTCWQAVVLVLAVAMGTAACTLFVSVMLRPVVMPPGQASFAVRNDFDASVLFLDRSGVPMPTMVMRAMPCHCHRRYRVVFYPPVRVWPMCYRPRSVYLVF